MYKIRSISGLQRDKTCLWGFWQNETQSPASEASFACSKFRHDTFPEANNKGAEQMRRLVCTFVVCKYRRQVFLCHLGPMVDVLKFQTLVACQKVIDKQHRPRSDCFLVKQSDQGLPCLLFSHAFCEFSPDFYQHFIWVQKVKIVNFRT